MSTPRWLLVGLLFFLDVRVRAEHSVKTEDCWGKTVPCAVQAGAHKRELNAGREFKMVLAAGALAQQSDAQSVRLVDGGFYIDVSREVAFRTPYAIFTCVNDCKALVERVPTQVNFRALAGTWKFVRTGENKEYELGGGLQITVGEVESDGKARMDFPQSLPWSQTVLDWARLYSGSIGDFKHDASTFRQAWTGAVESVSAVHAQSAARAVASFEAGLAKERARRKAELKEEADLRELFRKKTIDP